MQLAPQRAEQLALWICAIATEQSHEAFAQLFAFCFPRLVCFLTGRGLPRHQAEEVAQDTLQDVWRCAPRAFESGAEASRWLYTLARNHGIRAIYGPQTDIEIINLLMVHSREQPTADDAILKAERMVLLRQALDGLPAHRAQTFLAATVRGESAGALAKRLNVPQGTVKSTVRRTLHYLRAILT